MDYRNAKDGKVIEGFDAVPSHATSWANVLNVGGASFIDTYATLQAEGTDLAIPRPITVAHYSKNRSFAREVGRNGGMGGCGQNRRKLSKAWLHSRKGAALMELKGAERCV